jgi:subtilase family serine protease
MIYPLNIRIMPARALLPDLTVESITTSPTDPLLGEALNIEFLIKNIGSEDSNACTLEAHYGTETKEFRVPQLRKGSSYIVRDQLIISSEMLTVRAKIDSKDEVDELNENNNEAARDIKAGDFEISVEPNI